MSHLPPDDAEQALRLKRMASVYGRMVQPTGAEVAAKWHAQQGQTPSKPWAARGPVSSVAAGLIAGGILAAGASQLHSEVPEHSEVPDELAPAAPSLLPPQSVSPPAVPTPSSELPARAEPTVAEHRPTDETSESRRAPVGPRTSVEPAEPTAENATERWRIVAGALRENDTARAREVLSKLSKSGDPSTRDAAALARAQLDAADGKLSSARAVFERVARQGATSQLRAQAQRSLRQLEAKGE